MTESTDQEKFKRIFNDIWEALDAACCSKFHRFNRMQVATVHQNQAVIRTVILRKIDKAQSSLEFYTDIRSPKIEHLKANPKLSIVLYDEQDKIQLRLFGKAQIHYQNESTMSRWKTVSGFSKLCYANKQAPGQSLSNYHQLGQNSVKSESFDDHAAYQNFALIEVALTKIDWLDLSEYVHKRACFTKNNASWRSEWLAP